jgi:hypothetical protein
MENLELIENYFKGNTDAMQKQDFENKITRDAAFADDVAFYISANGLLQQQLREEKKQRFKEIYNGQKVIYMKPPVRNMWKLMAAASIIVAILIITWFVSGNKNSPKQLADTYVQQNFTNLGVTMGNQDDLQKGLQLFNENNFTGALQIFETLATNDPKNSEAEKYAGMAWVRLGKYDKALTYFSLLASNTGLHSNPGKLYKAITLLERNKDGDKVAAKLLLQQVRDEKLEGKNEAEEWLKKF